MIVLRIARAQKKGRSRPAVGEDAYAPRCRAAAAARARWPQPRETPWPRLGDGGRVSARLTRRRALSTSPEHVQPGRDRDACAARSVASDAPVGLRAAASVSSVPSAKTQVAEVFFLVRLEPLIFFRPRNATFEEETTRLTRRDTSRRAVSDLETPPCDAAKVRATARPGIAASSPSRARRAHRSRRLGTRRSRRVDAFGFGLGRSTTVGWRCARDRQPSPSPHERRHSD